MLSLDWNHWTKNDVLYGIITPVVVILLIVLVSQLDNLIGGEGFGIITGITMQLEELLLITVIPLLLGLVWNQWAGGASGFIMGSIYALYWADSYRFPGAGFGANTVLLGYVLSPILIGYMAGSMNKKSENFRRMLISGITATTIGGIILFGIFNLSPINVVTGIDGFLLTVITRTACGAIIPIFAKLVFWYGLNN